MQGMWVVIANKSKFFFTPSVSHASCVPRVHIDVADTTWSYLIYIEPQTRQWPHETFGKDWLEALEPSTSLRLPGSFQGQNMALRNAAFSIL